MFPEDIRKAAWRKLNGSAVDYTGDYQAEQIAVLIAEGILEERKRCERICRGLAMAHPDGDLAIRCAEAIVLGGESAAPV